jgi:hypothetical protein
MPESSFIPKDGIVNEPKEQSIAGRTSRLLSHI